MRFLLSLLLAVTMQVAALSAPVEVEQPEFVVRVVHTQGRFIYTGTGSLARADLVLTCYHNVRGHSKNSLTVKFKDGTEVKAKVIRASRKPDLALLQLGTPKFDCEIVTPGLSDPEIGDTVTIGGFPKAKAYAEVTGEIKATKILGGFEVNEEAIQGMSGGPVLDADRNLVGVVWGSNSTESEIIDLQKIKDFFLNDLDKAK